MGRFLPQPTGDSFSFGIAKSSSDQSIIHCDHDSIEHRRHSEPREGEATVPGAEKVSLLLRGHFDALSPGVLPRTVSARVSHREDEETLWLYFTLLSP